MGPDQNTRNIILYLTGQVHGLYVVMQALIGSHPVPDALREELSLVERLGRETLDSDGSSNQQVEGYQFVVNKARALADAHAARNQ